MKRTDYLDKLEKVATDIDDKYIKRLERTDKVTKMASLARKGLKESDDFKKLEREVNSIQVNDFGNELQELHKIMTKLRKYKNGR